MTRFVLRRFAFLITTLFVVSILSFLIPYLGKGDPGRVILQSRLGDAAVDPAAAALMSRQLGLDKPLYVQYLDWLREVAQGNFGYSFSGQQPVAELAIRALGVTVVLALVALVVALIIAVPAGVIGALRAGKASDNVITWVTQALIPMPEYWLGPFGILVFAVWLGWLPAAGWLGPAYIVLPAAVLGLRPLAYLTHITRAAMIDILASPYITASRARGRSRASTLIHHGLRNGMPPVMTMFSLYLAGLMGGSVIVEVVFSVPGMGRLMYQSVVDSDIPVTQGALMFIVSVVVVITTLTDIGYALINPAVTIGDEKR